MTQLKEIDDILVEGMRQEILELRCPDCGGRITFDFYQSEDDKKNGLTIICEKCKTITKLFGFEGTPNCVKLFGKHKKI